MTTVKVKVADLIEKKMIRDGRTLENPITQMEIARATGIPQGTISRWVGDKVDRLDKDIMVKLCDYFDCDISDLLYLDRSGVH